MKKAQRKRQERPATRGGMDGMPRRLLDDAMTLTGLLTLRRKAFASEEFEAMSDAVRGFADTLGDFPSLRSQVESLSGGLEAVADYAREADVETVLEDFADFARRRPMATFVAAVAGGLVASRLIWPEHMGGGARAARAQPRRRSPPVRAAKRRDAQARRRDAEARTDA